jgi:hypothetical protein
MLLSGKKLRANLQDLSQRISRKRKAEAVGWCGVDAGGPHRIESTSNWLRLINLSAKRAGERSAGNLHAPFDVAGDGNQLTVRLVRHSQRKRGGPDRSDLRSMAPFLDPTSGVNSCFQDSMLIER